MADEKRRKGVLEQARETPIMEGIEQGGILTPLDKHGGVIRKLKKGHKQEATA